jgi:hypothetical protein
MAIFEVCLAYGDTGEFGLRYALASRELFHWCYRVYMEVIYEKLEGTISNNDSWGIQDTKGKHERYIRV